MPPPRTPRRFRRRLLLLMLGCALLPLLLVGLALERTAEGALSLSLEPLEPLLERAQARAHTGDPALEAELREARLNLFQVELARRSLSQKLPVTLSLALLGTALLIGGAAVLLGQKLSRPLEELTAGMVRLGAGELSQRLPESEAKATEADELELLVRQFNRMSSELEAQRARLKITENLAAWQTVARGLAHELKNPLTAMKLALARLGRLAAKSGSGTSDVPASDDAGRLREATELLADEIDVLLRMTEGFSQFAKLPAPEKKPLDLGQLLSDVGALWKAGAPVPIECTAPTLELEGDADQLRRLFGNLVKNAVEASKAGQGPIELLLVPGEASVEVLVRDRGAGIARVLEGEDTLHALGSTKPQGSGLGLPIAHKIAHDHGGRLRLLPRDGGGTEARVELPRTRPRVQEVTT